MEDMQKVLGSSRDRLDSLAYAPLSEARVVA